MSCQIKEVASIVNLQDVKQQLLAGMHFKSNNHQKEDVIFQDSLISLSPTGEILAIGWNSRIVVLESKWDSQEPGQVKNKLTPSWNKEVSNTYNERITAIACIPLILLGKSGAGVSTDWTCIAIGFTTGFIKFYTDDGTFLLETQLHNESIIGIKCQSFSASKYSEDIAQVEELHVIYNSVVCVLQGFSLCTTLRSYRTHLAKVQANCTQPPPDINLVCKKWGFRNQDLMNDCQVIGSTSVNTFDHLTTASICGGFNANYRSSAPQHTLVTATGKRPFVGFHYVLEGGSAPVLTDVAIAMASKVANAIGSAVPWFLRGNKTLTIPEKNKGVLTEPAESMTCRFGLSDLTREGYTIVPSPNKMLSAISDGVGRVILVDNIQGVAVRMFKGYRDAQCGWVEVVEEKHRSFDSADGSRSRDSKSRLRRALFLVIYAPKKGVIDIWLAQHGTKIATFSAGKNGRLLYLNYGLFGLNDTMTPSRPNRAHYPCVFIDSLGGIKEIIVPFHFALDSQNSQKSRDLHLFRKLKIFLREEMYDNEKLINEIKNTCTELRTNEVKLQILEMLMTNKNIVPDALTCAAACLHNAELDLTNEKLEPVQKSVYLLSSQLLQVIEFYKYVRSNFDDTPNFNTEKPMHCILQTSEREAHRMLKLSKTVKELESVNIKGQNRVKFEEDERAFLNFMSCFEFNEKDMVTVRKTISLYDKCALVELIYDGKMYSYETISTWQKAAKQSRIQPSTLMELLLFYWLNRKFTDCLEFEVIRCLEMVHAVCSLSSIDEVCAAENNQTSQWWDNVRQVLSNSTNPFHALIVAMACRVVALSLERNKELCANITGDNGSANCDEYDKLARTPSVDQAQNSETRNTTVSSSISAQSSISDWENVSTETCQFSLLIGNLEDITTLSAIVSKKPHLDSSTEFLALEYEKINVSLETIINRGKGSISEIVAKWLSSSGVDPIKLIDTTDIEFDRLHLIQELLKNEAHLQSTDVPELSVQSSLAAIETGSEAKDEEDTCLLQTTKKVSLLKLHFPYSLTSSVLLANLCWEYVMLWNEDKTRLDAFDAAVTIIRNIPMKHMRHGVCSLLWTLHVKQRMEVIAELMNEHGQLPKKGYFVNFSTIGLTVNQIVTFLQTCVNFLDIFLDAEILESDKCIEIRFEELWETQAAGPEPLATLAVSQAPAWYDSVMLHSMLANVLYMMAHFNLTVFKPLNNLFASTEQRSLFQDICDKPMFVVQQDPQLDSCRMEFLRRVITSSMESIQQDTTEASNFNFQQAFSWMCKCQTMASIWKINTDELRIHQVCQLYQDGFDRLADEVIISVNDTAKLAENLLPIAGGRLRSHLSKVYGQTFLNDVSRISPTLRTYLLGLDYVESNRVFTNCTNDDTIELARKVATNLPETSNNYHLAQLILDATLILTDDT